MTTPWPQEKRLWSLQKSLRPSKYIDNPDPYANTPYSGFVADEVLRRLGISFVDDTIPGVLVLVGKAKDPKLLAKIIRDCQSKGMLSNPYL